MNPTLREGDGSRLSHFIASLARWVSVETAGPTSSDSLALQECRVGLVLISCCIGKSFGSAAAQGRTSRTCSMTFLWSSSLPAINWSAVDQTRPSPDRFIDGDEAAVDVLDRQPHRFHFRRCCGLPIGPHRLQ